MSHLNKARKSKAYRSFKPGPNKVAKKKKRKFPDTKGKPILIIGVDQSVVNTGFASLYYDPSSEESIKLISVIGDPKDNSDLITNLIKVNHPSRSANMPDYLDAYDDYVEKINLMKLLLYKRLIELDIADQEGLNVPITFVAIESVFFGKATVIKNLIRHQTVTAINMRYFPTAMPDYQTHIYEYTAAEAKDSLGDIGSKKDNVTESVNNVFGTNMPTYAEYKSGSIKKSEYELFTHISDAIALAYALLQDFMASQIEIPNLFEEK